jgi:leucyl/phenylalanyl-tRNA--protein transferase
VHFHRMLHHLQTMSRQLFPPIEDANEDGLLAIGGDLLPETLLTAYSQGIFPWPINRGILAWFCPPKRAVLFLDDFYIPRRLVRHIKTTRFTTSHNKNFSSVIEKCAELDNRGEQNGTWITDEIMAAYKELHALGIAHSFETYCDDELVGGLYGVRVGNFFVAESSFYRTSNASKFAMLALRRYLLDEEITWFDCQMLTPFSESFGATEITRREFMQLLKIAVGAP